MVHVLLKIVVYVVWYILYCASALQEICFCEGEGDLSS
jgi:hypothetical protein